MINNDNQHSDRITEGLEFLLTHFNQERLFPRKIMTKKLKELKGQKEIFSKEESIGYEL
jgi:hypothetical protein